VPVECLGERVGAAEDRPRHGRHRPQGEREEDGGDRPPSTHPIPAPLRPAVRDLRGTVCRQAPEAEPEREPEDDHDEEERREGQAEEQPAGERDPHPGHPLQEAGHQQVRGVPMIVASPPIDAP